MATVRPGVLKKGAFDEAKANAVEVVKANVELSEADMQTEVVEVVKAAKKLVDLVGAEYVVSVGRGISSNVEEGIKIAHDLADALGGVVGGSRAAIDSGWLTADHQGRPDRKDSTSEDLRGTWNFGSDPAQSGNAGIRVHHRSQQNASAPIFEIADYGITGDLFKVAPMLVEAIKAAKAAKIIQFGGNA